MNKTMSNIQRDLLGLTRNKDYVPNQTQTFGNTTVGAQSQIMNRTLGCKDTFVSVLPCYGVLADKLMSQHQSAFVYNEFNDIEQCKTIAKDKTFYVKWDDSKKYTEEWLKTANMRGKK